MVIGWLSTLMCFYLCCWRLCSPRYGFFQTKHCNIRFSLLIFASFSLPSSMCFFFFLSVSFYTGLENTWAVVSLFLIGKLCITSAFSTSYVHTAEMLPTVIRSIGVGAASTVARIGALVAPFVPLLVSFLQNEIFFRCTFFCYII